MRRNNNSPWKYLGLVIVLGIVAALAWWFLSPAFIDNPVNESLPTAVIESSPTPVPAQADPTAQPQPTAESAATETEQILLRGAFYNVEHLGSGEALVYQLADGSRILRFQNFSVDNGPDLYVYLVPIDPVAPGTNEISGFHSLGQLKGNIGDQNYDIPADLDLSQFRSVVIWCQAFAVPFSAAPLTAQ